MQQNAGNCICIFQNFLAVDTPPHRQYMSAPPQNSTDALALCTLLTQRGK